MTSTELEYLPRVIADYILNGIKEYEEEEGFFDSYYLGMNDAEKGVAMPKYSSAYLSNFFFDYQVAKNLRKAKNNLQQCNTVFNEKDGDLSYTSIVPGKLYYKTLEEGRGQPVMDAKTVL